MRKIVKFTFCLLILIGCTNDNNLLEDIAVRGGFIQFKKAPSLKLNILEIDNVGVSEELIDPNNNATSYSLTLYYNGMEVPNFKTITSFPSTLEISMTDVVSSLGIALSDIKATTKFTFVATIVTPTGTYSGLSPNFDSNNVNQGGDSTVRLKSTGLLDAIEFDVTFFTPPGKTVKGTSFEEVAVGSTSARYTRNGSSNSAGDLINGVNPPFVDFTSTGNEIGFNSEFVPVPGISSSSLGFSSERIGVTIALEDVKPFPDGTNAFHIEDPDGAIKITFDKVDIPSGQTKSGVSFDVFFRSTSWESKDGIKAYVNVTTSSGSSVIQMANLLGSDANNIEGEWNTINTGYLDNILSYQLVVEMQSGHDTEDIYIDNIIVYVPKD